MDKTNYLKSFFTEHWKYMAVNAACKINLFDSIGDEKYTATELADKMEVNKETLDLLLKSLHSIDFLEVSNGCYALNDNSTVLQKNHSGSLKYACMIWSGEHLDAWQNLDYSIKTGTSSFNKIYHDNYFEYLNKHPEKLDYYHKAMFEYAREDYKDLASKIDFTTAKNIIDVGGGYGAAINWIKIKHPQLNCFLFDLEKVIENCSLTDIIKLKGNFFEEIPAVADVMLLSRILHDWKNEQSIEIVKNCFKALPAGGTLYIIENCSDKITVDLSLLSLNMLAMCDSYERTSEEYIEMANIAGFTFVELIKLNELQSILKFKK